MANILRFQDLGYARYLLGNLEPARFKKIKMVAKNVLLQNSHSRLDHLAEDYSRRYNLRLEEVWALFTVQKEQRRPSLGTVSNALPIVSGHFRNRAIVVKMLNSYLEHELTQENLLAGNSRNFANYCRAEYENFSEKKSSRGRNSRGSKRQSPTKNVRPIAKRTYNRKRPHFNSVKVPTVPSKPTTPATKRVLLYVVLAICIIYAMGQPEYMIPGIVSLALMTLLNGFLLYRMDVKPLKSNLIIKVAIGLSIYYVWALTGSILFVIINVLMFFPKLCKQGFQLASRFIGNQWQSRR